jgi:CheY-like chemotaxis protein
MGTVLIVEDHCRSRDLLKNLVEKEGRAVVTAGDGRDGLECARGFPPPSLILLDLYYAQDEWMGISAAQDCRSDDCRDSNNCFVWLVWRRAGGSHELVG